MKKLLVSLILMIAVLTACAPATPTEPPSIFFNDPPPTRPTKPVPTPTHTPVGLTPAQKAAALALSESLGLPVDQIAVISTEAVTWPDGCLGVQRIGAMCTQALVEGFKIILEAKGGQYEFHTNQDGSLIVLAESDSPPSISAEDTVVKQLANNLGLNEKDITVVSSSDVEFGDACLGVSMPEVMCAQVVTPGQIIALKANGLQYEYHVGTYGERVQPATIALTWKREGGIAGFCDNLTVFLSGEVYGSNCNLQEGRMKTFASLLSASEQKQFAAWIAKYGQVNLDASDPKGVADGMTRLIVLFGNGSNQPSKADEEAIFLWAQDLFQKLYK